MEAILEWLFQLFGKRTAGQLAGAALVGAFFGAMPFFGAAIFGQEKNLPPIVYLASIVAGALVCFIAGLFLLSPRRFIGAIFIFLGIAMIVLFIGHAMRASASMEDYAVEIGIVLVFLVPGVLLLRARRRYCAGKEVSSVIQGHKQR
jgi:hypothetical protein